jgi:GDP-mannose transporter
MADDKKSDDYKVEMGSARGSRAPSPVVRAPSLKSNSITENPVAAILGYCGSSIFMTVTNKYVLSGVDFNLNFFLLCVQVRAPENIPDICLTVHSLLSV